MVDSTNLPNIDINAIATDLNNKMDRDCLNYSETGYNFMAGAGMPSSRYIDLTLGASNTVYTAPADGYFILSKRATAVNQTIEFYKFGKCVAQVSASGNGSAQAITYPCRKGDTIAIIYYVGGVTDMFRFVYAVGSTSEVN